MPHSKFILPVILFLFIVLSCSKNDPPETGALKATLHDYTGLDGCSWIIKLESGEVLEPMNLGAFEIELKENKKIWVKYTEVKDALSICMVGPIVKVERIWER